MCSEQVINIENLSKVYHIYNKPIDRLISRWNPKKKKEFWALKNVSFSVNKGETVAIVGKNGSGKSTLLQTVCGTLNPTSGTAKVNGRIAALLELGAGFDLESTGRENVFINGMLLGMTEKEIRQKYNAIEKFADIGEFINQPVKTYSSGMFVRLAFAVIANSEPDVLIIDEALAVGDVFFVQKCMRFIRDFKKKGTILFVSHDTSAVTNLCDRAVWLVNGEVKRVGPAKDVTEEYLAYQHILDRSAEENEVVEINYSNSEEASKATHIEDYADCRLGLINRSSLRNDIKIVDISNGEKSFGTGKARIVEVRLLQNNDRVLTVIGGELVALEIDVECKESLSSIIAGFYFKDRLGQRIFGDNTYLSYIDKPFTADGHSKITAIFEFRMPTLPPGDYSIDVAFASGNQDSHTQHHWIHDAMTFKSIASGVSTGLVGVPMKNIKLVRSQ
ncbi:ABC transporter ATP-binding protein [Lonsdalea quercina]|uniref:ABC transporter ATP-binding protein n=1 Tax=Lonsdalea quercina TaxID=71657 RepID=UPI003976C53B